MKEFVAKKAGAALEFLAKKFSKTNCWLACYNEDVPQELTK
ncbi:AgrD family cyclic lactone autoinducer peptide [Paenibacillus sp. GCM10023248]|nr:cyclic lactone autoinducer peptide [Paenibacillus sp. MAHUQ-63]MDD9266015.1 cyclic lactone autoinducer peptide [Paenibacillus sp. MAHUQ-63]